MKNILLSIVSFLAVLGMTTYITGCSSDDSSGDTTTNYSGPGSQWNVSLGTSTFTIEYADEVGGETVLTVNGTYETVAAGYLKLTVTSSEGVDGPEAGQQAYALNIPGFVFMLKPMGNDGEIIPMIASGTCPTSIMDFNWMVTSHEASGQGADLSIGRDLVGTASFNGSDTMTVPSKFDLGNNPLAAGDSMSGTCANGIIALPDDNANIWLSASGAALVQVENSGNESVIVAMPQDTLATTSDLDGDYIGIVFNEAIDENSDSETRPVWLTMTNGSATAGGFTDVDAGTKSPTIATMTGFTANSPANGFMSGTLTDPGSGDTAPVTCQTTTDVAGSGKNLMFCVGVDTDSYTSGDKDQLYTVLLISQ